MKIGDPPVGLRSCSVALDRTKRLSEGAFETRTLRGFACEAVEGDDSSAAGDEVHQTFEGCLDGIEIFVDVGVIEFDGSEDDCVRKVVEKLWALIEKGGVVLVAFKNEVMSAPEVEARSEIFGNATDQEGRMQACGVEYPGQHWGCCGLAVCSGYDEDVLPAKEFIVEQLRQGAEWNALVEDVFEFDIAARHSVADHDHVGARLEILRVKRLGYGNVQFTEEIE